MKTKNSIVISGVSLVLILSGCTSTSVNSNNTTNQSGNRSSRNTSANSNATPIATQSPAPTTGSDFFKDASIGGMAEVEFSKEILKTTKDAEIKKFAEMMIADHGKANAELKSLATKKNVTLPSDLDESHKKTLEEIRAAEGVARDDAYVKAMVDGHDAAVSLFEDQSRDNADKELQAFAAKTLPTLKGHQEKIIAISDKR